jgi:hypothetical protein
MVTYIRTSVLKYTCSSTSLCKDIGTYFITVTQLSILFIFPQNSLFGQGIYLSSQLGICLIYSPYSAGWGGSCVGSELSIVSLCSIVDDPDQVKCQEDTGGYLLTCKVPLLQSIPIFHQSFHGGNLLNIYFFYKRFDRGNCNW